MRPVIVAFRFVALVILVSVASLPVVSQTNTGRILGTVTDQTGAAINAAKCVPAAWLDEMSASAPYMSGATTRRPPAATSRIAA